MSTFDRIRSSRRLVWAGVVVGYGLAIGVSVANLTTEQGNIWSALALFGGFGLSPTLAWISLDRRPSLLTVAWMGVILQGAVLITSVGLLELVPAVLWYLAQQRRPREAPTPGWAPWGRPVAAVVMLVPLLVMFVHLDPECTVTRSDGTVTTYRGSEAGVTGWNLSLGTSTSISTSFDGDRTECASNTVVWWETALSLAATTVLLSLAWRNWPTSEQIMERRDTALEPDGASSGHPS